MRKANLVEKETLAKAGWTSSGNGDVWFPPEGRGLWPMVTDFALRYAMKDISEMPEKIMIPAAITVNFKKAAINTDDTVGHWTITNETGTIEITSDQARSLAKHIMEKVSA